MIFPGIALPISFVSENNAGPRLARRQPNLCMRVVSVASELPMVTGLTFGRLRHRLLVDDLWLADRRLDVELTLQPVDDYLELQLAHPTNDRPAGLDVAVDPEGRVCGH